MAFKPSSELNGEIDPNINLNGRPQKKLTNRQIRELEFLKLLRKLKPHVADSIKVAAEIMNNEEASDMNKLKAAVILLDNYKSMVKERYSEHYDSEESEQVQTDNTPIFSLKVVGDT